jgi:6-phosphogluconate dehydrogenase
MGTSGGPEGAKHGACFMCGGEAGVVNRLRPLLEALSVPGGFVHCGPPGAGHFVKLVHNGIEFGMMQAIGEGLDLLEKCPERIDTGAVLEAWRHGTVIRSWLIDLLARSFREEDGLRGIEGYVEDTGEVNWLVEDAARMEVPIPAIAQSVWQLMLSRDKDRVWARAIAAMRHGFGGHPYGPDEAIARLRKTSRGSP